MDVDVTLDRARMLKIIPTFSGEHFTSLDLAIRSDISRATALRFITILVQLGIVDRIKARPSHFFVWREGERSPEAQKYLDAIACVDRYHDRQSA